MGLGAGKKVREKLSQLNCPRYCYTSHEGKNIKTMERERTYRGRRVEMWARSAGNGKIYEEESRLARTTGVGRGGSFSMRLRRREGPKTGHSDKLAR